MCSISQAELEEAYEMLNEQAVRLIAVQSEIDVLINLSQFQPDKDSFHKVEGIVSPKIRLVEYLTKEYYLQCQVKGIKIRDGLTIRFH